MVGKTNVGEKEKAWKNKHAINTQSLKQNPQSSTVLTFKTVSVYYRDQLQSGLCGCLLCPLLATFKITQF